MFLVSDESKLEREGAFIDALIIAESYRETFVPKDSYSFSIALRLSR